MNRAKSQSEAEGNLEIVFPNYIKLNQEQKATRNDYTHYQLQKTSKLQNSDQAIKRTDKENVGVVADEL